MTSRQWRWIIRIFYWLYILATAWFVQDAFSFLAFNTLLGYIPIELSFWLQHHSFRWSWVFWLVSLIWLLFYPNAPYLLTDFFHLALLHPYAPLTGLLRNSLPLWTHFLLLVGIGIITAAIAQVQAEHVLQKVSARLPGKGANWLPWLRLVLYTLTGIGIYIGRFLRLHTVYLLTPTLIWGPLSQMWSWHMMGFVVLMMGLQYLLWAVWQFSRQATN